MQSARAHAKQKEAQVKEYKSRECEMWSRSWAQAAVTCGREAGSRRWVAFLTRARRPCGCGVREVKARDICGLVRLCAAFIFAKRFDVGKPRMCKPAFAGCGLPCWLARMVGVGGQGVGGCAGACAWDVQGVRVIYLSCTTRWLVAPASRPPKTEAPGLRSRPCRAP